MSVCYVVDCFVFVYVRVYRVLFVYYLGRARLGRLASAASNPPTTADLRTEILDLRDSSRISMLRDLVLMSMWDFLEISSQQILVGILLVGRLVVDSA